MVKESPGVLVELDQTVGPVAVPLGPGVLVYGHRGEPRLGVKPPNVRSYATSPWPPKPDMSTARIVDYSMAERITSQLAVDAPTKAIEQCDARSARWLTSTNPPGLALTPTSSHCRAPA